jgi:hypothetical protein
VVVTDLNESMHKRGHRRRRSATETADGPKIEKSSKGGGGGEGRRWDGSHGLRSRLLLLPVVATTVALSLLVVISSSQRGNREGVRYASDVVFDLDGSRWREERVFKRGGDDEDHDNDDDDDDDDGTSSDDWRQRREEEGEEEEERPPPPTRITSSIDAVVSYLKNLAMLSPDRLWEVFGMMTKTTTDDGENYGDDPFSLKSLEGGNCPWRDVEDVATNAPWLPPTPLDMDKLSSTYRANRGRRRMTTMNGGRRPKIRPNGGKKVGGGSNNTTTTDRVALWYEHVSKAGGTSFCAIAKSNMEVWEVPKYHCMPGKGKLRDGLVGSWTINELRRHLTKDSRHAIVSSEWTPFNSIWLTLSGRDIDDGGGMVVPASNDDSDRKSRIAGPRLLFLTTLRDPCDRLLSSYTFFAVTVKTSGNKTNHVPPTFHEWLDTNTNQAAQYERKTGQRIGLRGWTMSHNHVTWRFSGGLLSSPNIPRGDVDEWMIPYEVAIRALCQFDLILPMDVMTKDGLGKAALKRMLGWTNFEARRGMRGDAKSGHVVNVGGIQNSNARSYFGETEYRQLWEDNWLDNILYLWCRAVFLARLHCNFINRMEG